MDDLDDIIEDMFDLEDVVEDIFEPDELIEDFLRNPTQMISGLLAVLAAIFTIVLVGITGVLVLLATGPIVALALIAILTLGATLFCIAAFLYLQTDLPADVRDRVQEARKQADDEKSQYENMSETEAVDKLKSKYVNGEISMAELEHALDETLGNNDPQRVIREYN